METTYTIEQIRSTLLPVFIKNGVRRATLFGSYCKGNATSKSDIDILVDSGLRGMSFFGLLEDVCQSVDCGVDLIDTVDVIPGSRIDNEIKQTGVVIYEQ